MTFGSNKKFDAVINIELVRLPQEKISPFRVLISGLQKKNAYCLQKADCKIKENLTERMLIPETL